MVTSPQKITEARKERREKLTPEQRQLAALEEIADTLEALRIDAAGAIQVLTAPSRQSGYTPR